MDASRTGILQCTAKVRLIEGKPGVGKTWFGCELARHEILRTPVGIKTYQKILFLTFARNAAARIREVFSSQKGHNGTEKQEFTRRLRIDTFCGFFWWLLESYGRYAPNGSTKRLWLIGSHETSYAHIPPGYEGYTFDKIEARVLTLLRVQLVRVLVSDIYPLVIVDEFQDVHERLLEIIEEMGRDSRLVLLRGPGQCIYRSIPGREFDPNRIQQMCLDRLNPTCFDLPGLGNEKQRYCAGIRELISQYEHGAISGSFGGPVVLKAIPPKNANNNPNRLEIFACLALQDMKRQMQFRQSTFAILASTNQAVADLGKRLREGSEAYRLAAQSGSVLLADSVLLQYGRLMLCLLRAHWIARRPSSIRDEDVAAFLSLLVQEMDRNVDPDPSLWENLAQRLAETAALQRPPADPSGWQIRIQANLSTLNSLLRETQKRQRKKGIALPRSTPFNKGDIALLETLKDEFIASIKNGIDKRGHLDLDRAIISFEKANQQKVVLEKLGVAKQVQIMTIHRSKGREFDGVVLVLDDTRKGIWRRDSGAPDEEIEDLYRVAISRAKSLFVLVAFKDAWKDAAAPVRRLLPEPAFVR